jgi:hypothetical protein
MSGIERPIPPAAERAIENQRFLKANPPARPYDSTVGLEAARLDSELTLERLNKNRENRELDRKHEDDKRQKIKDAREKKNGRLDEAVILHQQRKHGVVQSPKETPNMADSMKIAMETKNHEAGAALDALVSALEPVNPTEANDFLEELTTSNTVSETDTTDDADSEFAELHKLTDNFTGTESE